MEGGGGDVGMGDCNACCGDKALFAKASTCLRRLFPCEKSPLSSLEIDDGELTGGTAVREGRMSAIREQC